MNVNIYIYILKERERERKNLKKYISYIYICIDLLCLVVDDVSDFSMYEKYRKEKNCIFKDCLNLVFRR